MRLKVVLLVTSLLLSSVAFSGKKKKGYFCHYDGKFIEESDSDCESDSDDDENLWKRYYEPQESKEDKVIYDDEYDFGFFPELSDDEYNDAKSLSKSFRNPRAKTPPKKYEKKGTDKEALERNILESIGKISLHDFSLVAKIERKETKGQNLGGKIKPDMDKFEIRDIIKYFSIDMLASDSGLKKGDAINASMAGSKGIDQYTFCGVEIYIPVVWATACGLGIYGTPPACMVSTIKEMGAGCALMLAGTALACSFTIEATAYLAKQCMIKYKKGINDWNPPRGSGGYGKPFGQSFGSGDFAGGY